MENVVIRITYDRVGNSKYPWLIIIYKDHKWLGSERVRKFESVIKVLQSYRNLLEEASR